MRECVVKVIFCLLLTLVMTGCTTSSGIWNRYPPPYPTHAGLAIGAMSGAAIGGVAAGTVGFGVGTVMGGIVGASFGNIIEAHMDLVDRLQYNGVQVIVSGDEVKLILPTDRFFKPNSPLMNMNYYPILDMVGDFIVKFQKINILVAGYTDNCGPWQRNLALSTSRAESVMKYLWNYGIDARLVYARGYGDKHPIANNDTAAGRSLNRRVEISLRRIRDKYNDC